MVPGSPSLSVSFCLSLALCLSICFFIPQTVYCWGSPFFLKTCPPVYWWYLALLMSLFTCSQQQKAAGFQSLEAGGWCPDFSLLGDRDAAGFRELWDLVSHLSATCHLSPTCLLLVSHLSPTCLRLVSHLSPSCLPLVSQLSHLSSTCFSIVSLLSPSCLPLVCHLSATCLPLVSTCPPLVSHLSRTCLPLVCDLFVPHLSRPCLPLVCIGIPLVCFLSPTKKNTEYHFLDVKSAAAKKDLVAACKVISFESQTLEPLLLLGGKARLISLDLSPSVLILVALWMSLFNCLPACVSRCPALRVSLLTCAPRSVGSPGV